MKEKILKRKIRKLQKRFRRVHRKARKKLYCWYIMDFRSWLGYFGPYRFVRNLKYGIENLVVWLPTIWRDRDWDEYFLFRILELKFKRMEHLFRTYSLHVGAERTAHRLKTCRLLCKRLAEEEYTTLYDERNRPHLDWIGDKIRGSFNKEPNENGFITVIDHNEPDEPDARWVLPAAKHKDMLHQQDVDLLCKIIQKHVRGWWD